MPGWVGGGGILATHEANDKKGIPVLQIIAIFFGVILSPSDPTLGISLSAEDTQLKEPLKVKY